MKINEERADHCRGQVYGAVTAASRAVNRTIRDVRIMRRRFYDICYWVITYRKKHFNDLQAVAKADGMTVPKWIDDKYAPIFQVGESADLLNADIENGMTKAAYVEKGERFRVDATLSVNPKSVARTPQTPKKAVHFETKDDEIASLRTLTRALRGEIRNMRLQMDALSKRNEILEAEHCDVAKAINKKRPRRAIRRQTLEPVGA